MDPGESGIMQPRLRLRDVLLRGALYGLAAVPLLVIAMLGVADHHDRMGFLAVAGGLGLVFGGGFLLFGLFFWAVCGGDIRRWRDWPTVTGQTEGVTIMAPALVRCGVTGLVPAPVALWLYGMVDEAAYDSWLYGS